MNPKMKPKGVLPLIDNKRIPRIHNKIVAGAQNPNKIIEQFAKKVQPKHNMVFLKHNSRTRSSLQETSAQTTPSNQPCPSKFSRLSDGNSAQNPSLKHPFQASVYRSVEVHPGSRAFESALLRPSSNFPLP
jgi:hypothetical protein